MIAASTNTEKANMTFKQTCEQTIGIEIFNM